MDKTKVFEEEMKVKHNVYTPIYQAKYVDELPENPKLNTLYYCNNDTYYSKRYINLDSKHYDSFKKDCDAVTKVIFNKPFCEEILNKIKEHYDPDDFAFDTIYITLLKQQDRLDVIYYICFCMDEIILQEYYPEEEDSLIADTIYKNGEWYKDTLEFSNELHLINDETYFDEILDYLPESHLYNSVSFEVIREVSLGLFKNDRSNVAEILSNTVNMLRTNVSELIPKAIAGQVSNIPFNLTKLFSNIDFNYISKQKPLWNNILFNYHEFYGIEKDEDEEMYIDGLIKNIILDEIFCLSKGVNYDVYYNIFKMLLGPWNVSGIYARTRQPLSLSNAFSFSDITSFSFECIPSTLLIDGRGSGKTTPGNMQYMFNNCFYLKAISHLSTYDQYRENTKIWPHKDTASCYYGMFDGCQELENITCDSIQCGFSLENTILTDESLINICRALDPNAAYYNKLIKLSSKKASRVKNDIFVKLVDPDSDTKEFVVCNKDDEGAMSLYDYAYNHKNGWYMA